MEKGQANPNRTVAKGWDKDGDSVLESGFENGSIILKVATQDRKIFPRGKDPTPYFFWNPRKKMNHLIDFMIIHQGIINANDAVMPEKVIVSVLIPDVVPISKALEEIVEDIGAG
jgi:hypothetical protein